MEKSTLPLIPFIDINMEIILKSRVCSIEVLMNPCLKTILIESCVNLKFFGFDLVIGFFNFQQYILLFLALGCLINIAQVKSIQYVQTMQYITISLHDLEKAIITFFSHRKGNHAMMAN